MIMNYCFVDTAKVYTAQINTREKLVHRINDAFTAIRQNKEEINNIIESYIVIVIERYILIYRCVILLRRYGLWKRRGNKFCNQIFLRFGPDLNHLQKNVKYAVPVRPYPGRLAGRARASENTLRG